MIIGYTTGVFDLFHVGHLNILQSARAACDFLIVGVSTDELTTRVKGAKLVMPYEERSAIVASIRHVDRVVPQTCYDKMAAWRELRFDVMFVGDDWKGTDRWNALEIDFAEVGVDICYLPYTRNVSSTKLRQLLNEYHPAGLAE